MRSFGIYIRKARNRETKWRDKAITTSVTHNNVFCNTCCLNWNALITDYWGPSPVSRAWPGFGSLQAAANSIMSFWRLKAAQNCTTSGRGFVRTCKKERKKKKWVEEVAVPAPFKASLRDRTEQGVMCGRAAPKQAHGRNSSAGCWADCLTDLLVEVVWWAPSPVEIFISICKPMPIDVCAVTYCYSAYRWKKQKAEYAVHTPDMQKSTSNFTKQGNYVRLKHELMKTKLLGLWKRLTAVKGFSKRWHLVSPSTVPPTVSRFTYSYTKKQCNWSLTLWSNIF